MSTSAELGAVSREASWPTGWPGRWPAFVLLFRLEGRTVEVVASLTADVGGATSVTIEES